MASSSARLRVKLKAAWALSCITSPSCPVRVRDPLSGHDVHLNGEDIATGGRPGDARSHPNLIIHPGLALEEYVVGPTSRRPF